MSNLDLEKVYAAIKYFESDPDGEISTIINDYAEEYIYFDVDDIDLNIEYTEYVRDKLIKWDLTDEEISLIAKYLVNYLGYKINTRIDAKNRAFKECDSFYGDGPLSYNCLFEKYLVEYGNNYEVKDIILDEKNSIQLKKHA